jgi:hypothetical protein
MRLKLLGLGLGALMLGALLLRPRASAAQAYTGGAPLGPLRALGANNAALRVAAIAWDEWSRAGLDPRVKIALTAIGWHETRLQSIRSAAGLRDDQLGGSWGPWQVAASTARALGRPTGPASLGSEEAAIRDQARTAIAFAKYAGLLDRALRREEVGAITGELATSWGAGHSRDLQWVLDSPLNTALGGRLDSTTLRAALAGGTLGPVGALVARRILTARELAGSEQIA